MNDDQIDDKTRAQVMRELAEGGVSWTAGELRDLAGRLDPPPEYADGDYAVWDKDGTRFLAIRDSAEDDVSPWWVIGRGERDDAWMRQVFPRISRLRVAELDEVIIKREDAEWVAEYLRALPPMTMARAIHADRIADALDEQGGESRG